MSDAVFDREKRMAADEAVAVPTVLPAEQVAKESPISSPKPVHSLKPKSMSIISSFFENPPYVTFETQEPDEKILLFLRKSKITTLPWIFFTFILLTIPPILFIFKDQVFFFSLPLSYAVVSTVLYYLLVATYAFVNFITWYFNAALITNRRIMDIDFHQLVIKDIAETKMNLVQDVSYQQTGVLPALFNYGHVLIQTAGVVENFEFNALPKPEKIVQTIEELIGKGRPTYGV